MRKLRCRCHSGACSRKISADAQTCWIIEYKYFISISQREAAALKYQDLTKPLEEEEARVLALQEIQQARQKVLEFHQVSFLCLVVHCLRRKKHSIY